MAQDFEAFCRYCEHVWTDDGKPPCDACMPNKFRPTGSPWWWRHSSTVKWMEMAKLLVKGARGP